jgi:deoxyribodipyrimidine photo-lyase
VTDDYPTGIVREQTARFMEHSTTPVHLVDANGILPMRAFGKEEYSARFLRDKAHRMFPELWSAPPRIRPKHAPWAGDLALPLYDGADPSTAAKSCAIDQTIAPVHAIGGRGEALRRLDRFIAERLAGYADARGREADRSSELSPYLHFGFISIHEIARRVLLSDAPTDDIDAFLEESIIRRELSFNFCFYRRDHDSLSSLPDWAKKTIDAHRADRRKPQYSYEELEAGDTHDEVWNLSQRGLREVGTIHNYLRMLWGKKIIEWSATPEEAHATMIRLHARYALDGRDPNTHAGVLWCFGKHDRAWAPERPIFGTLRYMSSDSTRRKVDLRAYAASLENEPA